MILQGMVRKWNDIPSISSSVCQILWECLRDINGVYLWGEVCETYHSKEAKCLQWDVENDNRPCIISLENSGSEEEASSDEDQSMCAFHINKINWLMVRYNIFVCIRYVNLKSILFVVLFVC